METIRANNRKRLVAVLAIAAGVTIAWMQWRGRDGRTSSHGEVLSSQPVVNASTLPVDESEPPSGLTTVTFDELLVRLRTARRNGSVADVETLLHAIAQGRPAVAIELARAIGESGEEISRWMFALVGDWAAKDAEAALRWLGQQSSPDTAGNLPLLNVIFDQMAGQDSKRLVEISEARLRDYNSAGGFEPQMLAHACVDALIKTGNIALAKETVEAWAQTLEATRMGAASLESIALHIAQNSPRDAAEWLKKLPVSDGRNFAAGTLASDWAARDPQGALQWASSLASDEGRDGAMRRAYGEWVEGDPAGAAEWLDRNKPLLRAGAQTDSMVANLVAASPMVQSDSEGALLWADLISEPSLRSDVMAGVFARWLRMDQPAAASQLNLSLELTPQQKDKIIRSFQESRFDSETNRF